MGSGRSQCSRNGKICSIVHPRSAWRASALGRDQPTGSLPILSAASMEMPRHQKHDVWRVVRHTYRSTTSPPGGHRTGRCDGRVPAGGSRCRGHPLASRPSIASRRMSLLVAPLPPQRRSLSLSGARVVATQLRDAVARRHDLAMSRVGNSRACPFDLHAYRRDGRRLIINDPETSHKPLATGSVLRRCSHR